MVAWLDGADFAKLARDTPICGGVDRSGRLSPSLLAKDMDEAAPMLQRSRLAACREELPRLKPNCHGGGPICNCTAARDEATKSRMLDSPGHGGDEAAFVLRRICCDVQRLRRAGLESRIDRTAVYRKLAALYREKKSWPILGEKVFARLSTNPAVLGLQRRLPLRTESGGRISLPLRGRRCAAEAEDVDIHSVPDDADRYNAAA